MDKATSANAVNRNFLHIDCKNNEKTVNLCVMKRLLGIGMMLALALSCGGPKKPAAKAPATREFPMVEIPAMITEPQERAQWLSLHFWEPFTKTDKLYFCDSTTVNGVPSEKLEQQVGLFATLLQQLPLPVGQEAMKAAFGRLEAFQEAQPEGNVFPGTSALISRYFYDPNSPVRSEDLYLPFVSRLASSGLVDEQDRGRYAWEAQVCSLNQTGTPAADFTFVDIAGKRRTLYGIRADYTLLIFGNPDCNACREIMEQMAASPEISALIRSGRLKVADIYIDEEIDLWKEKADTYPREWINGYDPAFTIRTDRIYAVRAVPSLYLLDEKKNVLLKDALPETVLQVLPAL